MHVTSLTKPGQEPHDLEISAKQTAALQESDAVLYLKGLQPSVDDAVAQSERQDQDRRRLPHHAGEARQRGRRPRGRARRPRERGSPGRPRPAHLARPGALRPGRRGRRQGLREGRPGPRRRLPDEHRGPREEARRPEHAVQDRPGEHADQGLRHHPRRLRLPRRALRPDRGGHHRPRPRLGAERRPREGARRRSPRPTASPPSSSRRSSATRPRRPSPPTPG